MDHAGWRILLDGYPWFRGEGHYPIRAYSEFMPPVRTGLNPYDGSIYPWIFRPDDPYGWQVWEIEEEYQLKPGLEKIGKQVLEHIRMLGEGTMPASLIGHQHSKLANNIFWSEELAACQGKLKQEKYIIIMPFSLSKTKDDKGRICWTFFGASEQGPEKAFWRSFYESPGKEMPEPAFVNFFKWVFREAYGIDLKNRDHLISLGFRILPSGDNFPFRYWKVEDLPSWTKNYLIDDARDPEEVKYLLTFRPFDKLPARLREKYASGRLQLIPFPGNLVMWGFGEYIRLQENLPNAIQIPMLRLVKREEGFNGLRVPQSGWVYQPGVKGEKAKILEEYIVGNYIRTSRWDKFHRHEDGLLKSTRIDPVMETLFSTNLKTLDLYSKPMAKNSQIFTEEIELLLDGPHADRRQLGEAALKIVGGGNFRYRFYFPPMLAGIHEVVWHRPLVACLSRKSGEPVISTDLIKGYMTGIHAGRPDPEHPVELWPRFRDRELYQSILKDFDPVHDHYLHQTSLNLMAILDAMELLGETKLTREMARDLVRIPRNQSLDEWLAGLPERALDPAKAKKITRSVESVLLPAAVTVDTRNMTFSHTASREYEEAYWNQIKFLAHGEYIHKDNADITQDNATLGMIGHSQRDLHRMGDWILERYRQIITEKGMEGKAEWGELPFRWETDFEFVNYGGWKANQEGQEYERNLLVVIPGKNRREAVVMADHYDTAYMADIFYPDAGGSGARISAAGADDNHSATATLLLAAPIFLEMSKKGMLERDIWLLHLTGEEFPADCMGSRDFCRKAVERTLKLRKTDGNLTDLSETTVTGVLVMDMIAHNRDNARDVFQISPGKTKACLELARQAHLACHAWNAWVPQWNESPDRKDCQRGQRIKDLRLMPPKALFLKVDGEIRTWEDPHSTLYNTDGMIFADTGIPVILFMENYDISRSGYHDTHDTMENIDLDYGSAVSAIAIETIARLATLAL